MELSCSQSEASVVVDMAPSCSLSDPEKRKCRTERDRVTQSMLFLLC